MFLNVAALDARVEERGMSLNDLSRMTGVARSSITSYRNGKRSPAIGTIDKFAAALGCSWEDLIMKMDISEESPVPVVGDPESTDHLASLRASALMHYGLACACCKEAQQELLTISALPESEEQPPGQQYLFKWLFQRGYPEGYETLCFNCSHAKGDDPKCPHGQPPRFKSISTRQTYVVKLEAFKAYGGRCTCCGESDARFLLLDGASAHRPLLSGTNFYRSLRTAGYPKHPPMRVLCHNCNHGNRNHGVCPHQH